MFPNRCLRVIPPGATIPDHRPAAAVRRHERRSHPASDDTGADPMLAKRSRQHRGNSDVVQQELQRESGIAGAREVLAHGAATARQSTWPLGLGVTGQQVVPRRVPLLRNCRGAS